MFSIKDYYAIVCHPEMNENIFKKYRATLSFLCTQFAFEFETLWREMISLLDTSTLSLQVVMTDMLKNITSDRMI